MVELLASLKGNQIYVKYRNELEQEYAYWMEGASNLKPGQSYKRVVRMPDGTYLNRYWDDEEKPRQESYAADVTTAKNAVSIYISNKKFDSQQSMEHAADSIRKKHTET
jgi:alpha,alpha-trehalase